ncbi:IS4 family transposase [Verrucomicrobium sp. BvORR034]|uniref:IS4 family transposase n=1 Tax=Verrucomicrobium sp. BvORR034 TaxID=1396418 RepID=UPI000679B18D|nr:IS4 family transposase [Verrucomicrobium sp. BvORR034]
MTSLPDENWDYLLSLLPEDWESLAKTTGAVRRLRGAKSLGSLLRVLLLHAGHGCSLRTASVVGKAAGWISMSDVALHKRFALCEAWLQQLCAGLFAQSRLQLPPAYRGLKLRLVDGTIIKEPGATGSQWRVHYSLQVPDWHCDFFRLSPVKGSGNGESLKHFEVAPGDCFLADRGFSHLLGIEHVYRGGAHVIMRLNEQNTPLEDAQGRPVVLLPWLRKLKQPGAVADVDLWVRPHKEASLAQRVPVRLCAVRKSVEAAALAQRKVQRRAQQDQTKLRAATLEHTAWIVVLTTVPRDTLSDVEVLQWYRVRWQIELAFKRLKSLGDVGHLPKSDERSSRAWVYAKLLIALLSEKMQRHAAALSPWGGRWLENETPPQPLARD